MYRASAAPVSGTVHLAEHLVRARARSRTRRGKNSPAATVPHSPGLAQAHPGVQRHQRGRHVRGRVGVARRTADGAPVADLRAAGDARARRSQSSGTGDAPLQLGRVGGHRAATAAPSPRRVDPGEPGLAEVHDRRGRTARRASSPARAWCRHRAPRPRRRVRQSGAAPHVGGRLSDGRVSPHRAPRRIRASTAGGVSGISRTLDAERRQRVLDRVRRRPPARRRPRPRRRPCCRAW